METRINNAEDAAAAVEKWRGRAAAVQAGLLREAVARLELDQMYYEQKGNEQGTKRCVAAIAVLRARLVELDG